MTAYPISADEFAAHLKELYSSPLRSPMNIDISILQDIPEFTTDELEVAIKQLANLRRN